MSLGLVDIAKHTFKYVVHINPSAIVIINADLTITRPPAIAEQPSLLLDLLVIIEPFLGSLNQKRKRFDRVDDILNLRHLSKDLNHRNRIPEQDAARLHSRSPLATTFSVRPCLAWRILARQRLRESLTTAAVLSDYREQFRFLHSAWPPWLRRPAIAVPQLA